MRPKHQIIIALAMIAGACQTGSSNGQAGTESQEQQNLVDGSGQSAVQDNVSQKNILQVASGSADHSTLVAAVKAGELVDVLSNAGPFTVFAPTNAAFDALPAGTVDDLLKPENKEALVNILEYHVSVGVYKAESFNDGQVIGQVNGGNISISKKDGKTFVNGIAEIVASIPTTNGVIHVLNAVLTPKQ